MEFPIDSVNSQRIYEIFGRFLWIIVEPIRRLINSVNTSKITFMSLELFANRETSFFLQKNIFDRFSLCIRWKLTDQQRVKEC